VEKFSATNFCWWKNLLLQIFVVQVIIGRKLCGINFFIGGKLCGTSYYWWKFLWHRLFLSGENLCCKLFYWWKFCGINFFIGGNFVV
jgi:hypothetical protein